MDPDRTTTIGDDDAVNTHRPFHTINADERTSAKFRSWESDCRVLDKLDDRDESMVMDSAKYQGESVHERAEGRKST